MKATLEVNEAMLKEALTQYFKSLNPGAITLSAAPKETAYGQLTGVYVISARVEVDIEATAQISC